MRAFTATALVALLVTGGWAAASDALPPKPDANAALGRTVAAAGAAGLAGEILIVDAEGGSTGAALGLADRATKRPHVRGERWLWASVTKQVTAILLMQEVQAGRLALDAPVGQYFPAFAVRKITLRQLLQHQSGLPNPADTPVTDGVQAFYRETGPDIGDAARAKGFCATTAKVEPGGDFEYNNCDYLVLGAVLEAVTGTPYDQLIAARIAQPLNLKSLRVARDSETNGGADVPGYSGAKPYPAINIATGGAAAALVGSAEDLAAIDRALMTGKLLDKASQDILWTGNRQLGYEALGVWSFPASLKGCGKTPVRLIERRGDFGGTQARNIIAPDLGRALIVFTNDDGIDFGEIWQGSGLSYDMLSAAFCPQG